MATPAHKLRGISNLDYSIEGLRHMSIVKVGALRPHSSLAPTRAMDLISNSRDPFSNYICEACR